jgi:AcrR family transcriptional regulator
MTRDDILDAAAQVIRKKGFHGASMADIAEAVNLQKASLYHHVSSKQEILLDLLERALQLLSERISAIATGDAPADEKLRRMIKVYLQSLAENSDLSSVLLFEHRSLDKKSHARHIPHRDKFEGLWRDVVNEGVRAGIFACADVPMAVRALMGVMNWTLTWYSPDGPKSIEQIADQYAGLLFNGLLVRMHT